MALQFKSGPLASLSMSCASYLGAGHRIEFFGEDGTLVLQNPGADYMRGFELSHAKRPAATLGRIVVSDPVDAQYPDGRIAPVSRLAKHFFDAIESDGTAHARICRGLPRAAADRRRAALAQSRHLDRFRRRRRARGNRV